MNFSYPPSKRPIFAYKLHRRTLNGVWGWRKQFIVAPSVYTGAKKNDEKNSLGTLINKNHNREKNLNCFFNFLHIFFRIFSGNSIFQKNIKKLIFSGNSIFRRKLFPFFFEDAHSSWSGTRRWEHADHQNGCDHHNIRSWIQRISFKSKSVGDKNRCKFWWDCWNLQGKSQKIAVNLHEIAEMKPAIAKNAEKTATKSWWAVCFIIENGAGGRQKMR